MRENHTFNRHQSTDMYIHIYRQHTKITYKEEEEKKKRGAIQASSSLEVENCSLF